MKQNLQKSILFPFIFFIIILTVLLVVWSTYFISQQFNNETEKRAVTELSLFSEKISSYFTAHKQIGSFFYSKKSITSYLNSFSNSEFKKWITFTESDDNFSLLPDERFLGISNKNDLRVHQSLILSQPSKQSKSNLQTNLNTYLKYYKKDPNLIYGIIYKHHKNSSIIINNTILTERVYNELSLAFLQYQNNSNKKSSFQEFKSIQFKSIDSSAALNVLVAIKPTSNKAIFKKY